MTKKEFNEKAKLDFEADHCGCVGWAYGHWDADKVWIDSGVLDGEKITAIFVLDETELNFEDGTDVNWDADLVAYEVVDTGQIVFLTEINKMNQDELIDYARELENGESGRTFEESAEYWRDQENDEIAELFDEMVDRWYILENGKGK